MPNNPVIRGYLDDVDEELDAVERLAASPPNRLAAFHLQQAAEKLAKAVRLYRGLPATTEHRISLLTDELSDTDNWKTLLNPLDDYSQFATAYRYPGTSGRVKMGPTVEDLQTAVDKLRKLLEQPRIELV